VILKELLNTIAMGKPGNVESLRVIGKALSGKPSLVKIFEEEREKVWEEEKEKFW
jgi:hypothetical protein